MTTVGIVIALLVPALEFFGEVDPVDFLFGTNWAPLFSPAHFGVLPLVAGTLLVTFFACLVALPLGLGVAIYLAEYSSRRVRSRDQAGARDPGRHPHGRLRLLRAHVRDAAAARLGLDVEVFNALSAGLVMGVMLLPTVASLSEDAMAAVPQALRQGGYALGANRLQVSTAHRRAGGALGHRRVVRARDLAGRRRDDDRDDRGRPPADAHVRPAHRGRDADGVHRADRGGDVPTGSIEYKTIFAVGLTLFVATLILNALAIRLVRRYREVYE